MKPFWRHLWHSLGRHHMLDLVNLLTGILLDSLRDLRLHKLIMAATLVRALKVRKAFPSTMKTYLTPNRHSAAATRRISLLRRRANGLPTSLPISRSSQPHTLRRLPLPATPTTPNRWIPTSPPPPTIHLRPPSRTRNIRLRLPRRPSRRATTPLPIRRPSPTSDATLPATTATGPDPTRILAISLLPRRA